MQHDTGRLFAGIFIAGLGVIFLLGSLGEIRMGWFFAEFWPLILIFVGIWHMAASNFRNLGGGLILIVLGGLFLLSNMGWLPYSAWRLLWPSAVIVVGLWLIFRPRLRAETREIPNAAGDDLSAFVMFWGGDHRITTRDFRGGKATAIFGGIDIDLRDAGMAGESATVDLTAIFGGIDLKVSKDWDVVVDPHALLGGVDNKHRASGTPGPRPRLYVRGTALFGGIDIKD